MHTPHPAHDPTGSQTSLRELWDTVRRHRWLVVGMTCALAAAAAVYSAVAPPTYESVTTIRIVEEEKSAGLGMLAELAPLSGMGLPGLSDGQIETEIGVLRSVRLADTVAQEHGLHVELRSPWRERHEVLQVLAAPREAVVGRYALRRLADGSYAPAVERARRPVDLPERVRPGEPFRMAGLTLVLVPTEDPPSRIRFRVRRFQRTIRDFREDLVVERQDARSRLVEVSYRTDDPELAAAVVNGIADHYVRYKRTTSHGEARTKVEVLREQVALYEAQLRDAERRLQSFQEQERVIAPAEEAEAQIKRMAEMQILRDQMQVERASLAMLLAQVRAETATPDQPSPYRKLATFPSFIANGAVENVLETLNHLEGQRSALLARRTEQNTDVVQLTQRIEELESQLHAMATAYLESLDGQITSASAALDRFGLEIEAVPARAVEYVRLMREQKLLSEVYVMLQTRLKEAEVQDAIDPGDVRIVDRGQVPDEPVWPRPAAAIILAAILGLMLGLGTAFGRDLMNTRVRSRTDAEQAGAGAVLLGVIPHIDPTVAQGRNRLRQLVPVPGRRIVPAPEHVVGERLVTRFDPRGPAAEAYRSVRTSLTFASLERPPQLLVVTSAHAGDGKSVTACNLAITLAQQGTRVLLVDADLRKGMLNAVLGAASAPGLAQVILGSDSLEGSVQTLEAGVTGATLDFLAAGDLPPNPSELLGSARMREVLAVMRDRYDAVVFDTPPVDLFTDAAVLGTASDAAVVVARAGITERESLDQAVRTLRSLRVEVAGIVLNDTEPAGPAHYPAPRANGRRPARAT